MKSVYESKRDGWIVILLWAAVIAILIAVWDLWGARLPLALRLPISVLMVLTAAFVFWVLYGTRYTLTDKTLTVQSGPFRWVIDLETIIEISPTRNPISSPACSLDRLHIRYRPNPSGLMISPQDKAGFLRDLVERTPGLKMDGDSVFRDKK
ncbi:MAG TPA: PH domain-containing protein [Syntrophales bacterium]|nr:PH domain-containing protein [Syntrophales bacterium]